MAYDEPLADIGLDTGAGSGLRLLKSTSRATVLVAEPDPFARTVIVSSLRDDTSVVVVGEAWDDASLAGWHSLPPVDVLVLDAKLASSPALGEVGSAGLFAGPLARARVLLLADGQAAPTCGEAIRTRLHGVVHKDHGAARLGPATQAVSAGLAVTEIDHGRPQPARRTLMTGTGLTAAEARVLRLVAAGLTTDEVAAALSVARGTVKSHVSRILTKVGVVDRAQLVAAAYLHGFASPMDSVDSVSVRTGVAAAVLASTSVIGTTERWADDWRTGLV